MTNGWTCIDCGNTSDDEHAPCDCDDTCTEHAATIRSLRAQLAEVRKERDEAREVLARIPDAFDAEDLDVEHTLDWNGPHTADHGMPHPICGDDNDACTRETCPAIWIVNDAARITDAWRKKPK